MAENSCLAEATRCYNVEMVSIGKSSIVSQHAYMCTASHDPHRKEFPLIGAPIVVGEGAWIAADAFVSPGVTIGDRGVVAARAVVVRNVRSNMIVGGNPAVELGMRRD